MNDIDRDKTKHAANTEVVRRMLIKYFMEKGFSESFDRAVNPILIQDLPYANFGLDTKVEIEPHAIRIDPTTSFATIGWNLFVLGTQRMYLGETSHDNLMDLARQIRTGQINNTASISSRRCTTPRRIIYFIERCLGQSDAGYVDLTPRSRPPARKPRAARPAAMAGSMSGQFYTRSGYGTA